MATLPTLCITTRKLDSGESRFPQSQWDHTKQSTNSSEHSNANTANIVLAVKFIINKINEVCNLEM